MANWEFGVVFGPKKGSADMKRAILKSLPLKVVPLDGAKGAPKYEKDTDLPFIMDK